MKSADCKLQIANWRLGIVLAVLAIAVQGLAAQPSSELDRKLFEPAGAGQGSTRGAKPAEERRWDRELGTAAISEDEQPLVEVVQRMRTVEQRILGGDCGPQTQQSQQEIVADLDRLIRQARSGGQASAARQQAHPSQPSPERQAAGQPGAKPGDQPSQGRQPGDRAKPGRTGTERPSPQQLAAVFGQVWGELPEQVRQQLLQQWSAEQFLPEYAPMIEQYFRRLTEAQENRR